MRRSRLLSVLAFGAPDAPFSSRASYLPRPLHAIGTASIEPRLLGRGYPPLDRLSIAAFRPRCTVHGPDDPGGRSRTPYFAYRALNSSAACLRRAASAGSICPMYHLWSSLASTFATFSCSFLAASTFAASSLCR